jgi:hypothetical protein
MTNFTKCHELREWFSRFKSSAIKDSEILENDLKESRDENVSS